MSEDANQKKAIAPSASGNRPASWIARFDTMVRELPLSGWLLIGVICVTGLIEDLSIPERILERPIKQDVSILMSPIVLILGIMLAQQARFKAKNRSFNILVAVIGILYGLFGVFMLI